jgi:hypothetical protein
VQGLALWASRYLESLDNRETKPADSQLEPRQESNQEAWLRQTKEVEETCKGWLKEKKMTPQDAALATYFRADAEVRLAEAKANGPVKKPSGESAHMRLDAAKIAYQEFLAEFLEDRSSPETLYEVSTYWRDAATALAVTKADRVGAAAEHLARMKMIYPRVKANHEAGRISTYEFWAAEYYVAEAEILIRRAREE